LDKYQIQFSNESKLDIDELTSYIKNEFESIELAEEYHDDLMSDIKGLEELPNRFERIFVKKYREVVLRRLVHKNFLVFYLVDDDKKEVDIVRVLYGGSNWIKKL
jgi:plasmid stabilization system protein ParE